MEFWEREYILKNLPELLKCTDCNQQLIGNLSAAGVLGVMDVTNVTNGGKLYQTSRLYEILITKVHGYKRLTKAVVDCKQGRAAKILFLGYRVNNVKDPFDICDISTEAALSAIVYFLGKECHLGDVLSGITTEDVESIVKTGEHDDDYIDMFITGEKKFILALDTIPPPPPFYIWRLISNRLTLNPRIFKEPCDDVFVFKGLRHVELAELARPNVTAESGSQLLKLTCRFVLLKRDQDWEEMKSVAKRPMHLIRVEVPSKYIAEDGSDSENDSDSSSEYSSESDFSDSEDENEDQCDITTTITSKKQKFILEDSVGASAVLNHFAETESKDKRMYLSETDFVETIHISGRAANVCFCDSPGTGKSWLLASIARKSLQTNPRSIICYIFLPTLTQHMKNPLPPININLMEVILKNVSPCPLSRAILLKALEKNLIYMELFFDGLDEVPYEYLQWTMSFLKGVALKCKNARIYVTSRPQMRQEMEQSLGVTAYNILPFTFDDQVNFLYQSWKQKIQVPCDELKLTLFANKCLEHLRKGFKKDEREMLGIPLECYLLSEVYSNEAMQSSDPESKKEYLQISSTSIYKAYKTFVHSRLSSAPPQKKAEMKIFHRWKALNLLFPEIADDFAEIHELKAHGHSSPEILSIGLLEGKDHTKSNFVHQTFAEFLVAERFADILLIDYCPCEKQHVVFTIIEYFCRRILHSLDHRDFDVDRLLLSDFVYQLFTFEYPLIIHFLDARLENGEFTDLSQLVKDSFLKCMEPHQLYEILQSCALKNQVNLFRFLKGIFVMAEESIVRPFKVFLGEPSVNVVTCEGTFLSKPWWLILLTCAKYSSVWMMEELIHFLEESLQINVKLETKDQITPLKVAVGRGDFKMVELLIDIFPWQLDELLHICVQNSYGESRQIVAQRCQIFELVLKSSMRSQNRRPELKLKELPILMQEGRIHLELIKLLVRDGADLYAASHGENIVHRAADYMCPAKFHEFCHFFIEDQGATGLFKGNMPKWKCPLVCVLRKCQGIALETIRMILEACPQVDMRESDDEGNNLILSAVHGRQHLKVIQELINRGADQSHRNSEGQGVLHLAAKSGDLEVVDFFISLGTSLEDRDKRGNTALLSIDAHTGDLPMVKHLVEMGAHVLATNNRGDTIAHKYADSYHFQDFVDYFLTLGESLASVFHIKNDLEETPLHLHLAWKRTIKNITLEQLLDLPGTQVNAADNKGQTYLHLASGNLEWVKILVNRGADVTLSDTLGNSVAHLAAIWMKKGPHFQEFVHFLIKNPYRAAIFGKANDSGQTPLQCALENKSLRIASSTLEMLLRIPGTDLNTKDNYGCNLFLSSAKGGRRIEVLKTLVAHGVDWKGSNDFGKNALHLAVENKKYYEQESIVEIIRYLISLGIDMEQMDDSGQTPRGTVLKKAKRQRVGNNLPVVLKQAVDLITKL